MDNNSPFVYYFSTINNNYFYDVNKDTIVTVDKKVYDALRGKTVGTAVDDETISRINALKAKGFLSNKRIKHMLHPDTINLKYKLDTQVEMLVLQVTQACNLTCSYCPYACKEKKTYRSHSNRSMSFDIAKKSIDFYEAHSKALNKAVIAFYGGEPLINFDIIKQSVEYSKEVFLGKDLQFFMTTNGTLLTDDIIDFLAVNDFKVTFSIDGPASVHDINRKQADGKGSFDKVFANLKKTAAAFGSEYASHVDINMVINPQTDPHEVLKLFEDPFFKDHDISVRVTVAEDTHLYEKFNTTDRFKEFIRKSNTYQLFDLLGMIKDTSIFNKRNVSRYHEMIDNFRAIKPELPDECAPSGPCIPGKRRLFVDVNGSLFPCERVNEQSDLMKIGSISDGFDADKTYALLNISQLEPESCRNCFALRHCSVCAKLADNNGTFSVETRNEHCKRIRAGLIHNLKVCALYKEYREIYIDGDPDA